MRIHEASKGPERADTGSGLGNGLSNPGTGALSLPLNTSPKTSPDSSGRGSGPPLLGVESRVGGSCWQTNHHRGILLPVFKLQVPLLPE